LSLIQTCLHRTAVNSTRRALSSLRPNIDIGVSSVCIQRPNAWKILQDNFSVVCRRMLHNTGRQGGSGAVNHVVFVNNNRSYLISTYVGVLVALPIVAYNLYGIYAPETSVAVSENRVNTDRPSVPFAVFSFLVFSVAFAATGFLIRRTLIRIDYSDRTRQFVGFRYNWRLAKKRIVFRPGEVTQVVDETNTWREVCGNVSIGGRRYYLPLKDFKSTYHYNLMVGLIHE